MSLHQASGEARLGVALASVTMLMWGTLPVALAILIERLDAESSDSTISSCARWLWLAACSGRNQRLTELVGCGTERRVRDDRFW